MYAIKIDIATFTRTILDTPSPPHHNRRHIFLPLKCLHSALIGNWWRRLKGKSRGKWKIKWKTCLYVHVAWLGLVWFGVAWPCVFDVESVFGKTSAFPQFNLVLLRCN